MMGQQPANLITMLGVRTGFLLGSRGGQVLPRGNCKLAQADVDISEIGRSHSIDVGRVSNVTQALIALNAAAEKSNVSQASGNGSR
jgi:thiamine pyrophosphate-dependent acetolactate synthase large subunit-like protein